MSAYLEGYGERDERRAKAIRWLLVAALVVIVGGVALYFAFRDYSQERQVSTFLDRLRAKDYKGAYALWGCTEQTPCTSYPFEEFLKDWGPEGVYGSAENADAVAKKSCEGGIIQFVRYPGKPDVLLWVDRSNNTVGFAPWRLKSVPTDFKGRLQEFMWNVTRNCKPLIEP